ncbi:hypothetical protein tb265_03830 [Gemmatimonadetes bacterium T265]|nr:hypothetical protein tb265_03830 [Gemmatimonadetes bacterium T265]
MRVPSAAVLAAALAVAGPARSRAAHAQTAAPPAPAAPPVASPVLARGTAPRVVALENGMQVIVVENHAVPLATAKLVVRTGAMTQTPDDQGIPHLFEHMLFKGYRGPGDRTFGQLASELRAGYNGTTSEELVTYYLSGPSEAVPDAVRLLAGLVRDARFEPEDLRTERFVVLGEMERDRSDPRDLLRRKIGRALWGDGWYRKNTIGEATALLGVSPARLRAIYGRYYVPNNAALVVTGDVAAERVVEAARRHFGPWRRGADPFAGAPVSDPPPLAESRVVVVPAAVDAVTLLVEWQGPSVVTARADTYAADVLAAVVDDERSPMAGRLVDSGNFQSAQFGYETLAHTGPLVFSGTTTMDRLASALTALAAECDIMSAPDYFDAPALADAAKRRRVAAALEAEAGPSLAHTIGNWWAVAGLDYHLGYDDALAAQTPGDLRRFVRRYVTRKAFVVGAVVPQGREDETRVMLEQFVAMAKEAQP